MDSHLNDLGAVPSETCVSIKRGTWPTEIPPLLQKPSRLFCAWHVSYFVMLQDAVEAVELTVEESQDANDSRL